MAINQNNLDLLINKALAIEDELALDADALGFMARAMVQANLAGCIPSRLHLLPITCFKKEKKTIRKITEALTTSALTILLLTCTPTIALTTVYGTPECGDWLSHQDGSAQKHSYTNWLMGFLSGYAMASEKNFLEGTLPQSTFFYMDKYCHDNPLNPATQGAITLINELKKQKGIK